MNNSITSWKCDHCYKEISASEGYVIWKTNDDLKAHSFRIIHNGKCDDNSFISSGELSIFLGADGLAYLLSFISVGPLKISAETSQYCGVENLDEFVDFIRRVQTPYYDKARDNFGESSVREDFSDSNEYYPYLTETLKKIANTYPK